MHRGIIRPGLHTRQDSAQNNMSQSSKPSASTTSISWHTANSQFRHLLWRRTCLAFSPSKALHTLNSRHVTLLAKQMISPHQTKSFLFKGRNLATLSCIAICPMKHYCPKAATSAIKELRIPPRWNPPRARRAASWRRSRRTCTRAPSPQRSAARWWAGSPRTSPLQFSAASLLGCPSRLVALEWKQPRGGRRSVASGWPSAPAP